MSSNLDDYAGIPRSEAQYFVYLATSLRSPGRHMEGAQWDGVRADVDNLFLHHPRCTECLDGLGYIFEVLRNLLQFWSGPWAKLEETCAQMKSLVNRWAPPPEEACLAS